jgi:hypothetical protein
LIDTYARQFLKKVGGGWTSGHKMSDFPAGQSMLRLNPDGQAAVALALVDRLLDWEKEGAVIDSELKENQTRGDHPGWRASYNRGCVLRHALERLLRRKLPLGEAGLIRLLRWPLRSEGGINSYWHCLPGLTRAAEYHAASHEVGPALRKVLETLIRKLPRARQYTASLEKDCRKAADRLRALLPEGP